MLIFQFEICPGMIKFCHLLHFHERFSVMAVRTIRAKFILVGILMTISAGFKCDSGKLLEFESVFDPCFMAFFAGDILMFAGKLELRGFMIEFRSRFKGIHPVAIIAAPGKSILVVIRMAIHTGVA